LYLDGCLKQGDQIGRILAHWATVNFGQLFENCRSSQHFWANSFNGSDYFGKKWVGLRVARFFLVQHTKTVKIYQITTIYTKWPQTIPIGHKL
jgi:hypothetical protein